MVERDSLQRDEYLVFSFCSENVTYAFCSLYISASSPGFHVMFSTMSEVYFRPFFSSEKWNGNLFFSFFSKVVRTPISSQVPHSSLSFQDGLSAMMAVGFGKTSFTCKDAFHYCFEWIVPPLTDPLMLFPPNPRWTGLSDVTEDFQETFISSGLSEQSGNGNVFLFVFGIMLDNVAAVSKDMSKVQIIEFSIDFIFTDFWKRYLLLCSLLQTNLEKRQSFQITVTMQIKTIRSILLPNLSLTLPWIPFLCLNFLHAMCMNILIPVFIFFEIIFK